MRKTAFPVHEWVIWYALSQINHLMHRNKWAARHGWRGCSNGYLFSRHRRLRRLLVLEYWEFNCRKADWHNAKASRSIIAEVLRLQNRMNMICNVADQSGRRPERRRWSVDSSLTIVASWYYLLIFIQVLNMQCKWSSGAMSTHAEQIGASSSIEWGSVIGRWRTLMKLLLLSEWSIVSWQQRRRHNSASPSILHLPS